VDLVRAIFVIVQENSNGVWKGISSYFGSTNNGTLPANKSAHAGSTTYIGTAGSYIVHLLLFMPEIVWEKIYGQQQEMQ